MDDFIIKDGALERYKGSSTTIVIPEGVHTIDMLAFSREKKAEIKSIQLPQSLEIIENWAFDHCKKLERVIIPVGVKEIGRGAFYSCSSLKEVIIEGAPQMGESVFSWTPWEEAEFKKAGSEIDGHTLLRVHPDLTKYTIPPEVKIIGRDAFKNSKIKEIDIPKGVTRIGICAFSYSELERISLPDTLRVIDSYAFSNCENLTELTVPKSVTDIDSGAFQDLPKCVITILNESDDEELFRMSDDAFAFGQLIPHIKEVRVPYGSVAMRYAVKDGLKVTTFPCGPHKFGNPKKYHYIDDVFCCEGRTLHEYFGRQDVVHVPEGIHTIGERAFEFSKVKKVCLPKTVKRIAKGAFAYSKQLEEVAGEGVAEIDRVAFRSCENLTHVAFPGLKQCYDISFENCNRLCRENIIIPDDTEIIEEAREPWICSCGRCFVTRTPFKKVRISNSSKISKRKILDFKER